MSEFLVDIWSLSKYADNSNTRLMSCLLGLMETGHESENVQY